MSDKFRCASCGRFTPEPYVPARLLEELLDALDCVVIEGSEPNVDALIVASASAVGAVREARAHGSA